jgi:hypothetical protein
MFRARWSDQIFRVEVDMNAPGLHPDEFGFSGS